MNSIFEAAFLYRNAGLSIIPVNSRKKSLCYWKKYQSRIMTNNELVQTFISLNVSGIAIICGNISGNLEVIDLDCKNDLTKCLFHRYIDKLNDASTDLVNRLVIAITKNGGYHLFYRSKEIEGNQILAKRHSTSTEKINHPKEKAKILIETRGTGGYVIGYPTPGYHFIQHDFKNISQIETSERQLLLQIAKSFNQYYDPISLTSYQLKNCADPNSPFDDYDINGNIVELLTKHGWQVIRKIENKTYFRRPGSTDHHTSGDYNHNLGLFGVFSTSTEFEPGKGYKPYAVYAILECSGNFQLAAKRLLNEGYGTPYTK
jgi:Bifunctional DNA primase/polymerase, N-terminal